MESRLQTHFDAFTVLVATSVSGLRATYITVLITGILKFRNLKFPTFRRGFEPVNPPLKYGLAVDKQHFVSSENILDENIKHVKLNTLQMS